MRVIAGSAKRLLLKTIEGKDTRPTTDRIKETLFNMMQNDVYGCTFLDLFSGSGAIGIEALSRGAEMAVMVEHNPRAAQCIRENLKITHLEDKATVMNCDVITALKRLEERQLVFDIVYMDPPYAKDYERGALEALAAGSIIDGYTTIIIEEKLDTDLSYVQDLGYTITKTKTYKTNKHVFLKKEGK